MYIEIHTDSREAILDKLTQQVSSGKAARIQVSKTEDFYRLSISTDFDEPDPKPA
jgi:hypothetical protein